MPPSVAKQRQFDKEVEALRQQIQASAKPFPADKQAQRERKARAEQDLDFFNRTYFPHYFSKPSSRLHKYFAERYPAMINRAVATGEGDKEANAAPVVTPSPPPAPLAFRSGVRHSVSAATR